MLGRGEPWRLKSRRIEDYTPFLAPLFSVIIYPPHGHRCSEFNSVRRQQDIVLYYVSFLLSFRNQSPSSLHRWRHFQILSAFFFARWGGAAATETQNAQGRKEQGFFPLSLGKRCMRALVGRGSTSTSHLILGRRTTCAPELVQITLRLTQALSRPRRL